MCCCLVGERTQRSSVAVLDRLHGFGSSRTDAISIPALLTWCDQDRDVRYPLAAAIIRFAHRAKETGSQVWSEQARALLANAPDPKSVLTEFVARFRPQSWSGSRAALMEENARLLDNLPDSSGELMAYVADAKAQLAREIASERQQETEYDRRAVRITLERVRAAKIHIRLLGDVRTKEYTGVPSSSDSSEPTKSALMVT